MFCYQCEQTARGTGCVKIGVCGKEPDVASLQDLLIYQLEGIAFYAVKVLQEGKTISNNIHRFMLDSLFATLTNVNFDKAAFIQFLNQSRKIKSEMKALAGTITSSIPAAASFILPETEAAIQTAATQVNIRPQATTEPDIQSLKDTLLFGMKGMSAYAHHAWMLDYMDDSVNLWIYKGLSAMLDLHLDLGARVSIVMEFGQINLKCMQLLDKANTETFGHP